MRIIAGKFRRRTLQTNPGLVTRPFTDRVKESLFENISQRIVGKRVADIFAGTGTMGLEALSRGAVCTTFIENDRVAVDLLRANVEMLKCGDDCLIWPTDAFRCSYKPKGEAAAKFFPFEAMFFDPPYKQSPHLLEGSPLWLALLRLARDEVSTPAATLILRVEERARFDLPSCWQVDWELKMSGMLIQVCSKGVESRETSVESQTE